MIARSHGKASKYLTMDIGPEMVGDLNSTDGPFDWTLTEEEEGNVKEILSMYGGSCHVLFREYTQFNLRDFMFAQIVNEIRLQELLPPFAVDAVLSGLLDEQRQLDLPKFRTALVRWAQHKKYKYN